MAEYELNLWDYWRIIFKRKWIIISIFLISEVSANFFVAKTEPIYQSSVTLNIDTQQPVAEITGSGVTFWGVGAGRLTTQLELIKSFNVLEGVALRLDLIDKDTEKEKAYQIVSSLRGRIEVSLRSSTSLVDINATGTNPLLTKDLAEAVAEVFIEKSWERKVRESQNTKKFVEKQLRKMDKGMAAMRKKLANLGISPSEMEVFSDGGSQLAKLRMLKLELSNLRERYTDNYPGIVNMMAEIKNIEAHLKKYAPVTEKTEVESEIVTEVVDVEQLQRELDINQKLYQLLKERYEKALIVEASKANDIEIVNPPIIPTIPYSGQVSVNLLLAGAVGLVLGLVAAFVAESLDTSIGTIEDVEEYLKIPVLGIIPHIEINKKDEIDFWKVPPPPNEKREYNEIMKRLITQYKPKSPVAEAYRNLQTYIKFSGLDKVGNAIGFTSASMKEGKTITTVNSAIVLAQMGYKVLLVDADLRKPTVHRVFGIKRDVGLSEVILGTFKLDDVVKTVDDIMLGNIKSSIVMKTYGLENLSIITSGHLPSNPTEILGSQNMSAFIEEVKAKYQVVLFDTAPVLPVTDSCVLSSKIDGMIIVYKAGFISRGALKRTKIQIENANGVPLGVVLNSMRASDMKFGSPFYYYYQKYYGEEEQDAQNMPLKNINHNG